MMMVEEEPRCLSCFLIKPVSPPQRPLHLHTVNNSYIKSYVKNHQVANFLFCHRGVLFHDYNGNALVLHCFILFNFLYYCFIHVLY